MVCDGFLGILNTLEEMGRGDSLARGRVGIEECLCVCVCVCLLAVRIIE